MWKVDTSPIILQNEHSTTYMGLCQHFESCGNYLVRDTNRWTKTNTYRKPTCHRCTLKRKRKQSAGNYVRRKYPSRTTKVKKTNSYYDREMLEANTALENGLFNIEEYEKEVAHLKRKYDM